MSTFPKMRDHANAMATNPVHRIVIVGGGAGGLPLATSLGNRYGRGREVQVTLVDRNATHVWKPLLHEVAAGRMDADAHALDYLAIAYWHHFRFRQGAIRGLDRARRESDARRGDGPEGEEILPQRAFPTNAGPVPRQREQRLRRSGREPASDLAGHARRRGALPSAAARRVRACRWTCRGGGPAQVNIVIIGAGATGVELAAEIRQTTHAHAAYGLDNIDPVRDIRITVLEAYSRVLPPLSEQRRDRRDRAPREARRWRSHRAARDRDRRRRCAHRERQTSILPISWCGPRASWRPQSSASSTGSRSTV